MLIMNLGVFLIYKFSLIIVNKIVIKFHKNYKKLLLQMDKVGKTIKEMIIIKLLNVDL